MMFPVYQVVESLRCLEGKSIWIKNLARILIVSLTVVTSLVVPNFGLFISLIGASCCSILMFILPALFHLRLLCGETHITGAAASIPMSSIYGKATGSNADTFDLGPTRPAFLARCFNYVVVILGVVCSVFGTYNASLDFAKDFRSEPH